MDWIGVLKIFGGFAILLSVLYSYRWCYKQGIEKGKTIGRIEANKVCNQKMSRIYKQALALGLDANALFRVRDSETEFKDRPS